MICSWEFWWFVIFVRLTKRKNSLCFGWVAKNTERREWVCGGAPAEGQADHKQTEGPVCVYKERLG